MKWPVLADMLKEAGSRWIDIQAPTLGAALAYYTTFSIAPLLVIAMAIAGMMYGEQAARGKVAVSLQGVIGEKPADAVQELLKTAVSPRSGTIATVLGVGVLLFGASGVFTELQSSLNKVWGVDTRPNRGVWGILRDRFLSFSMVLATSFLLLTSLVITTTLEALSHFYVYDILPGGSFLWHAADAATALLVELLLFAMIFKFVPDVLLHWRDVWFGAGITSVLFTLGKYLLSYYLAQSSISSAHGAVGSIVVVLFWVYYSSQIFLFGAVLTRTYAEHVGRKVEPTRNAIRIECKEAASSDPKPATIA